MFCLIKHSCSWHDKLIVLWTLNRQVKYFYIYSTFTCPFESRKCGKEGKKSKKFEYLKNEKSFLDEIKSIFYFVKAYHLIKK